VKESKKRILCVEDHSDICELITTVLSDYEVIGSYSKADALVRATTESFDLYLIDYHLPDGTGIELCLLIRSFDRDTPIFFCTGTSSINTTTIETAGAQQLIKKGAELIPSLKKAVSDVFKN